MGKIATEVVVIGRKQELGVILIPSRVDEMLYIFDVDIFSTGGKYFLTAADKFSKF